MAWTWTKSTWRAHSKADKFWRSSEFNKIETAIGRYNSGASNLARLAALKAILDAISAWRVWKQEKKNKANFQSPLSAPNQGEKIAAKEHKMRQVGLVGEDEKLSVRSEATDGLVRDVVDEINAILANERNAWGGNTFTDPHNHLATNFRYIVSAQTETEAIVEHRELTIKNPELIKRALISATVITHETINLWGPSGFILTVPQNCIGPAYAGDLGAANAVAMGHRLEKYREMLRLYLGQMQTSGTSLPAPDNVLRKGPFGGHNEVVVLGRNYGEKTSVSGIFVIVDQISDSVANIVPVQCYRVISRFTKGVEMKLVVEGLPGVTDRRMQQFQELHTNLGLPIVQIESTNAKINASYFSGLYKATDNLHCPFDRNRMVIHGSRAHSDLEAAQGWTKGLVETGHTCPICTPR